MTVHTIRLVLPHELDGVWALVSAAVAQMNAGGNHQWNDTYPAPCDFAEAIGQEELFGAYDAAGTLLGVGVFNTRQEDCYDTLSGWRESPPALVIHKVAVAPWAQGSGVASALFEFAFDQARGAGLRSARIDTYCLNGKMQGLLAKLGFRYVGNVRFPSRPLAFRVYEKIL